MKYSSLILGLICAVVCLTQSHAQSLTLTPTLNGQTLMPGSRFYSPSHKDPLDRDSLNRDTIDRDPLDRDPLDRDTIQIDKLKFYVSNVFLHRDNGEKVQLGDHYLFDLEKSNVLDFEMGDDNGFLNSEGKGYSQLSFCVGVDSLVNESGAQGGALDPMHGMYWTWNSGYINFKLEGRSTICPSRNHEFQLHIGGFIRPYASIRQVVLDVVDRPQIISFGNRTILFPMENLLSKIDLSKQHTIMSPSAASMVIADLFSHSFKMKTVK